MATLDEITKEKQRISEALARVDMQRDKLASQLGELEATERVLARYSKGMQVKKTASARTPATAKKAVARLNEKVGDLLVPSNVGTWPEVRDRLNRMLRGWSAYYSYGTRMPAYRAIDNHVYQSVRNFLRRRHKVPSRGTRRFSDEVVFGELGVLRLRRVHLGPRS